MRKSLYLLGVGFLTASLAFNPLVYATDTVSSGDNTLTENVPSTLNTNSVWSGMKFEEADVLPEGTQLIYSNSLGGISSLDNLSVLQLVEGSYKILSYDGETVWGSSQATATLPADDELGLPEKEITYETLVSYTNPADLPTILANEPVREADSTFKTIINPEAYLLLFKADSQTADDLQFIVKIGDLEKYAVDKFSQEVISKPSETATSSISLVEKIYDEGTEYCSTAKFKVNFNLGNSTINGVATEEKALCLVIDDGTNIALNSLNSGEIEFELRNLTNKTYSYYIKSANSYEYAGSFIVDFVRISENDTVTISDITPDVSFSGQPSSSVKTGTGVNLTMHTSNVDSIMSFNGTILGNGVYGKHCDFTVTENGTYFYSASTAGGKLTEGYYTVDFFEDNTGDDLIDPINLALVANDYDADLVQTGLGSIILLGVATILTLLGSTILVLKKKKGADIDEEN